MEEFESYNLLFVSDIHVTSILYNIYIYMYIIKQINKFDQVCNII